MTKKQQYNLERALAKHCSSEEVLLELVQGMEHFSHYLPYLWVLVRRIRERNIQFKTVRDVSRFVAENW